MPADDHPFDALEQQFQMEDLSVSPVTKVVLEVLSLMPLTWPFDKIVERLKRHLAADSLDRKSTRLNSSHLVISYAVFCLKKKKRKITQIPIDSATQSTA